MQQYTRLVDQPMQELVPKQKLSKKWPLHLAVGLLCVAFLALTAVEAATIEAPLIRKVPACNRPVVVVLAAAVATARSVVVATEVLAV
jgi:hypothetical protein